MSEPVNGNGGGSFTQKEMLVRIDGKVDVIAAKQQNYDVELALLKARVDRNEHAVNATVNNSDGWRDEVRQEISGIKTQNAKIAGAVAACVVLVNFIAPIVLRNWP